MVVVKASSTLCSFFAKASSTFSSSAACCGVICSGMTLTTMPTSSALSEFVTMNTSEKVASPSLVHLGLAASPFENSGRASDTKDSKSPTVAAADASGASQCSSKEAKVDGMGATEETVRGEVRKMVGDGASELCDTSLSPERRSTQLAGIAESASAGDEKDRPVSTALASGDETCSDADPDVTEVVECDEVCRLLGSFFLVAGLLDLGRPKGTSTTTCVALP